MTGEMVALRRDFLPEHLKPEISAVGIEGVVAVHARSNLQETDWLLDFADKYDFIPGVVGWGAARQPNDSRRSRKVALLGF